MHELGLTWGVRAAGRGWVAGFDCVKNEGLSSFPARGCVVAGGGMNGAGCAADDAVDSFAGVLPELLRLLDENKRSNASAHQTPLLQRPTGFGNPMFDL